MLLLAVSGGIDSMYLLNRAGDLFPGEAFAVAHCNFNLRGGESDGDEDFVTKYCADRGISCHVRAFDTAAYAAERGISIEMAARELRYGWFARLCIENGYRATVVAHNANDNAETLILNLLRGTGSRGARGMSPDSALPGCDGVRLLRPMLGIPRKEIENWMTGHGLAWREDRSNGESIYKRNIIRNEVFPLFAEMNPSFLRTLQRDMEHISQADDIAEDYLENAVKGMCSENAEGLTVRVPELLALRHWKFVLWRVLEPFGFSYETFGKLTALLERFRNEPRGSVTLGGKTFESPTHVLKAGSKKLTVSRSV